MAKAHTPHLLRGKIGNLIYRVRDGKQLVHLAPSPHRDKQRFESRMAYRHFRLNLHEFAGAATVACDVYRHLLSEHKPMLRPYSHNRMTALLKAAGDHHIKSQLLGTAHHHALAFRLYDAFKAFQNLDLSHPGAPAAQVSMTPVGPGHNPTAIRIGGLRTAARAVPVKGNARLEVRIHLRQTTFSEHEWSAQHQRWLPVERNPPIVGSGMNRPSGWIPVEALPHGDLHLDLPQNPEGAKFLTAVIVEWREVRAVDDKEVLHPKQAVVRIVSVHGAAADFVQIPYTYPQQENPYLLPTEHFNPTNNWRTHPQAYVKEAMIFIRT
jgi:hypothetical protein